MHTITRSVETRSIISAYSIPACSNIKIFNSAKSGAKFTSAFLSIDIKRGHITFYKMAALLMNVMVSDRMSFVFMQNALYIYQSIEGNRICALKDNGMRVVNRELVRYMNNKFGTSKTMRYEIKRTKSELGGNPLFELIIPRHMLKQYKNKNDLHT